MMAEVPSLHHRTRLCRTVTTCLPRHRQLPAYRIRSGSLGHSERHQAGTSPSPHHGAVGGVGAREPGTLSGLALEPHVIISHVSDGHPVKRREVQSQTMETRARKRFGGAGGGGAAAGAGESSGAVAPGGHPPEDSEDDTPSNLLAPLLEE
jgi:hypothetical protein